MTEWQKPEVPENERGASIDGHHDFWVEALTAGIPGGRTYMDGRLLRGVVSVSTNTSVGGPTTITITFYPRTLNKGERPPGE